MLKNLSLYGVSCQNFDYHNKTQGGNFGQVDHLLTQSSHSKVAEFAFFNDCPREERFDNQKGVYRTNCLDCLDRTNVTQARISLMIVRAMLRFIKRTVGSDQRHISVYGNGSQSEENIVLDVLKRMWTNNGDKISNQYTGTDSNMSGQIQNENQGNGFMGKLSKMITGVERFFNEGSDRKKHDLILMIIGKHLFSDVRYGVKAALKNLVSSQASEFETTE